MGPFVPSNSARGGSFTLPIVKGLIESLSDSLTQENQIKVSKYLILCACNANLIVSSTFLTGTIGNPFISKLAESTFGIQFDFITWLKGAIVPSLCLSFLLPLVFYLIYYPEYKSLTDEDVVIERKSLKISKKEILTCLTLILCLIGWIFGRYFDISETLIAFLGLYILLSCSVLDWSDVLQNSKGNMN